MVLLWLLHMVILCLHHQPTKPFAQASVQKRIQVYALCTLFLVSNLETYEMSFCPNEAINSWEVLGHCLIIDSLLNRFALIIELGLL